METYTGTPLAEVQRRIQWSSDDPNQLQLTLPGGLQVSRAGSARALGCTVFGVLAETLAWAWR